MELMDTITAVLSLITALLSLAASNVFKKATG